MALTGEELLVYNNAIDKGYTAGQVAAQLGVNQDAVIAQLEAEGVAPLATEETAESIHQFAVDNNITSDAIAVAYGMDLDAVNAFFADGGFEPLSMVEPEPDPIDELDPLGPWTHQEGLTALTQEQMDSYTDAVANDLSVEMFAAIHGISADYMAEYLGTTGLPELREGATFEEVYAFARENGISDAQLAISYGSTEEEISGYVMDAGLTQLDTEIPNEEVMAMYDNAVENGYTTAMLAMLQGISTEEMGQYIADAGLEPIYGINDAATIYQFAQEFGITSAQLQAQYPQADYDAITDYINQYQLEPLVDMPSLEDFNYITDMPTQDPHEFDIPLESSYDPDAELGPSDEEFAQVHEETGIEGIQGISQEQVGGDIYEPDVPDMPDAPTEIDAPVTGLTDPNREEETATTFDTEETAVGPEVTEEATYTGEEALSGFEGAQADEVATTFDTEETAAGPVVTEETTFDTPDAQQEGAGTEYEGVSQADLTRQASEDIAYLTSERNPMTALAKQRGLNLAEERGMGSGSFAARASEGAVLDYAVPIAMQSQQLASQERMAAQGLTGASDIDAKNRELQEAMTLLDFTFKGGESAADRQLARDAQAENTRLQELMQERDLAVKSGDEAKARQLEREIQNSQMALAALLQESQQMFTAGESASERQIARDLKDQDTRLQELMQERALAVQSGDAAAARELQAQIEAAQLLYSETQQKRDLMSLEYRNEQNLTSAERQNAATLTVQQMMQQDQLTSEQTMQLRETAFKQEQDRLNRVLADLQQERQLAFQRDDAELSRELNRQINNANVQLQLTMQDRDMEFKAIQAENDRTLSLQLQDIDIDYKKWLEKATEGHEALLSSNSAAVQLLVSYQDQIGLIASNPDSTTAQKQAAIDAIRDAVESGLSVIGSTLNVDLTKYLVDTVGYDETSQEA